jgi:hypothetical protein
MATISEFTVGNAISVVLTDETFDIIESPPGSADKMVATSPIKAVVTFQDMWIAHVAIFTYENRENVVEFSWSPKPVPPPFNGAVGRGRMTMRRVGDDYVFLMRALRRNNKEWPTLTQVKWEELDTLMATDAKAFFQSQGRVQFGRYGDMVENSRTMSNGIGVRVPVTEHAVITSIFVATRALAVLRNLSK